MVVGGLSGYLIKIAWKRYVAVVLLSLSAAGMVVGIFVVVGYLVSDIIDSDQGEKNFTRVLTNPLGVMPETTNLVLQNVVYYAAIRDHMHEHYGFPMPSLWLYCV